MPSWTQLLCREMGVRDCCPPGTLPRAAIQPAGAESQRADDLIHDPVAWDHPLDVHLPTLKGAVCRVAWCQ
ncbi:MAG: hypothetical protein PVI59_07015 [Anaerolineae bacterium]